MKKREVEKSKPRNLFGAQQIFIFISSNVQTSNWEKNSPH